MPLAAPKPRPENEVASRLLSALVFDEFPLWLETISRVTEAVGVRVLGSATLAEDAAEMLREKRPSLFIVGLNRAEAKRQQADFLLDVAGEIETVSTIVVSSDADPAFIEHCLSCGASAYVLKTIRPEDLSATIRQAVDRRVYLFGAPRRPHDSELDKLTPRELEVLLHVAEGLSNADVAKRLWISAATVKFHLMKTYEKLGVTNRTGAVRWAQRQGLLSSEPGPTSRPRPPAKAAAARAGNRSQSLSRS